MTPRDKATHRNVRPSFVTFVSFVTPRAGTARGADRAVNLLTAAFPGAVVDPQPVAEVDSDEWRRADNGQLAHRCQVCKSVMTCRHYGGRWTCSFCRPEES